MLPFFLTLLIFLSAGISSAANSPIFSVQKVYAGDSDEVSAPVCGDLKILITRNGVRQVTGFQWGNAAGTFVPVVSQTWERGSTGRILTASSNVSGAPSFDYKGTANNEATAFDSKGRRLKVGTGGSDLVGWLMRFRLNRQILMHQRD